MHYFFRQKSARKQIWREIRNSMMPSIGNKYFNEEKLHRTRNKNMFVAEILRSDFAGKKSPEEKVLNFQSFPACVYVHTFAQKADCKF